MTFCYNSVVENEVVSEKSNRKVLAYSEEMMLVEMCFEAGGSGPEHKHPHRQITYIVEGAFEFTVGAEKKTVCAGDSILMQADVAHSLFCLEKGKLIDVFVPYREDFLKK